MNVLAVTVIYVACSVMFYIFHLSTCIPWLSPHHPHPFTLPLYHSHSLSPSDRASSTSLISYHQMVDLNLLLESDTVWRR